MNISKLCFIIICTYLATPMFAQASFDIDFSYQKVFDEYDVPDNDTVAKFFYDAFKKEKYLEKMALPEEILNSYDKNNTEMLVFLDYQAFWYFGYRSVVVILKEKSGNLLKIDWDTKTNRVKKNESNKKSLKNILNVLLNWKASSPPDGYPKEHGKGYVFSGYVGVLSIYENRKVRQIPLVSDDLLKEGESGQPVAGKLFQMLY